jgi:serine/threonine protein kinase
MAFPIMSLSSSDTSELLMVGMSSKTYRIGNRVRKECHVLPDDPDVTEQNLDACNTEAEVYLILGTHPLIAQYLSVGLPKDHIEVEFYPHGNLKDYIERNKRHLTTPEIKRLASQMIESVAYVNSKGVRHSDLRLNQWLVDQAGNVRLSDFNASGYDAQKHLGLVKKAARGFECPSYYLPRPSDTDSSDESDLFALGSSLYELETGSRPFRGLRDEVITILFAHGIFPSTDGLALGACISSCWTLKFRKAQDIFDTTEGSLIH